MSDHGRAHATLGPSSAERWINCPASVGLIERMETTDDSGSTWAEEGTRAHDLGEIEASRAFGLIDDEEYNEKRIAWEGRAEEFGDDVGEMERHVRTYVDMLLDQVADMEGPVTVRLEVRVQTGVPGCWGTADAALMGVREVRVIDFKYGQGVVVRAKKNEQLMLYGAGVLRKLDLLGTVVKVVLGICQPRVDGGLTTWETTAESLLSWVDRDVMDAARETQSPDARYGPSEKACRWCPAAGICKPRMLHVTRRDFGDPDLMDEQEVADAFRRVAELRDWAKAVEAQALSMGYSEGKTLPGLKVVMSGGKRKITDEQAAIDALVAAGFEKEKVSRLQAQTLGNLEKVVGKVRLPEVLGDLLKKGDGSPSLVSDEDERPAVTKMTEATQDFRGE